MGRETVTVARKKNGVAERVGIEIPKENTLTTDEALVRERKGNEGNGELRIKTRAAGEGAQERDEAKKLRKQKTGDMEIEVLSQIKEGSIQVLRVLDTNMMQVSTVKIAEVKQGSSSTWKRYKAGVEQESNMAEAK